MSISLRLSEEDSVLFRKYAEMNGLSLSELVRQSVLSRIEDEYDLTVAREAYEDYVASGKQSRPISELWQELGI